MAECLPCRCRDGKDKISTLSELCWVKTNLEAVCFHRRSAEGVETATRELGEQEEGCKLATGCSGQGLELMLEPSYGEGMGMGRWTSRKTEFWTEHSICKGPGGQERTCRKCVGTSSSLVLWSTEQSTREQQGQLHRNGLGRSPQPRMPASSAHLWGGWPV